MLPWLPWLPWLHMSPWLPWLHMSPWLPWLPLCLPDDAVDQTRKREAVGRMAHLEKTFADMKEQ